MDAVEEVASKINISLSIQNRILIMPIPSTQIIDRICSCKEDFIKEVLVPKYNSFCKIMSNVGGSVKPTSVAFARLIKIMDKLSQFNSREKFLQYTIELESNTIRVGVTIDLIIKELLSFTKDLQKYFFQFKPKGKEEGRVFAKCHIMHNKKSQIL